MTTQTANITKQQAPPKTLRWLIWVTPLTMLIVAIANLALYTLASRLFPEVAAWPGAGLGQIIGATIVYLLIGSILFAIIIRISSHPARHYRFVATVGLLLSLALPISAGFGYSAPETSVAGAATIITLSLMHIISYAISVPLYTCLVLNRRS